MLDIELLHMTWKPHRHKPTNYRILGLHVPQFSNRIVNKPSPCRCVPMGVIDVHCFFFGSKHSTVFIVLRPSRPPTTNRQPSMTAIPNCNRRPFMFATCDQLSFRKSYFSMLMAPSQHKAKALLTIV